LIDNNKNNTYILIYTDAATYGDVYSPMKAENTRLQETEWTEDRQTS